MGIRKENSKDINKISEITIAAFKDHPISQNTEQFIINALRNSASLTISLVAEINNEIVGHIAFSPITISDGTKNWHGLGPVSVAPEYQKKGIGRKLIEEGLAELKEIHGEGCALVGDPNFYKKFGFKNDSKLIHEGIPQEVFLVLKLNEKEVEGTVEFHKCFLATS